MAGPNKKDGREKDGFGTAKPRHPRAAGKKTAAIVAGPKKKKPVLQGTHFQLRSFSIVWECLAKMPCVPKQLASQQLPGTGSRRTIKNECPVCFQGCPILLGGLLEQRSKLQEAKKAPKGTQPKGILRRPPILSY